MLETMITGSLPKPSWLADSSAELFAPWAVPESNLSEAQDDAVRLAIADQEQAGMDIVTDGEQRRRHYIWGFVGQLAGVDADNLGQKVTRGGRYGNNPLPVPRITGEIRRTQPCLVDALRFAKSQATRPVKVTLPGPMTIVDSIADEYYGDSEADLGMRFAEILNAEARDLAAAGADTIQFDEPCFNIYTDKVAEWGVAALDRAILNVAATTAVHICYGYGVSIVLEWKSRNRNWGHYQTTLPLLSKSGIDRVSLECAASGVDPSVLGLLGDKDAIVGVIDVGSDEIESADVVAERIRKALRYVDAERLYPSTDCGLVPRPRAVAVGKMAALAAGAALVRENLGGNVV